MRRLTLPIVAPALLASAACDAGPPPVDPLAHEAEVQAWHDGRLEGLRQPDGWLSLVGLHWLPDGATRFGSAEDAGFRYDGSGEAVPIPPLLGTFHALDDGSVEFEAAPGVDVTVDGAPIERILARAAPDPDSDGGAPEPPVFAWGPLLWHVMARGGEPVVRLKSAESHVLTDFEGIERFDVATAWRLDGRLEVYDPPKTIVIPNILGTENENESPAAAVFEHAGETYRLDLWRDSDDPANFFTAFADLTNAESTYGGGRFLWIDAPAEGDDRIVVDFNRSYNPPCVFTEFATCPLPPRQNRLPFDVPAGERTWGAH